MPQHYSVAWQSCIALWCLVIIELIVLHYVELRYIRPRNQRIAREKWENALAQESDAQDKIADDGDNIRKDVDGVERVLTARSA